MNTLEQLETYEINSKGDIPAQLRLKFKGKNIINFVILNGVNFYAVYRFDKTSLGSLVQTLFNNYECKNFEQNKLSLYSEQFKRTICEDDPDIPLSHYGFNRISRIKIIEQSSHLIHDPLS